MNKLFRMLMLGLFVAGVAACSKGGDEQQGAESAKPAPQVAPVKQQSGGYDPNADADSDC